MKKVLIISYFSLPFDVIASYRTNAYLKHFRSFGFYPTVLTHYMGMEEQNGVSVEKDETGTVIRVPIRKSKLRALLRKAETMPILNKVSILTRWILGFLDSRPEMIDSYYSLKAYCFSELDVTKFDMVIGIYSPHHHLRLCYKLHRKFEIPYVLDFRDLWDNRILHAKYSPSAVEKIQDKLTLRWWSKWLHKASFFTTTSDPWRSKLELITDTKGEVVTNGFDEECFTNKEFRRSDLFTIIHAGALYEDLELVIFLKGCKEFLRAFPDAKFKIKFLGADKNSGPGGKRVGFLSNPVERILKYIPQDYVEITTRVPKSRVVDEMYDAQIVLFLSHPQINGWYSGKVFDYLGARKTILMVPDDHSVVGDLILKTNAGVIANTAEEVCSYLKKSYLEWQKQGEIPYHGKEEEIIRYSRRKQVEKIAGLLNRL
ncbi:hypothetical protein [Ekhidna sp.]|uniref:hypothetical protein n=1 Tax=Ekhidna sp. TaxID=2608089 RepID=UPI003CCB7E04